MSDYIKRDDMKKVMCTVCCYRGICFRDLKCPLGEMIDAIPAADVRENARGEWISVEDRLPEDNEAVNVVWVNRSPVIYYQDIKDKPQSATGVYYKGQWYWWSAVVQDYLREYGEWDCDKMYDAIEVTHWMPLPSTEGLNET